MKTFVVRDIHGANSYITNAENAIEAAQYALARGRLVINPYIVIDHDLNACAVTIEPSGQKNE